MVRNGSRALSRLFRRLVVGIALAANPEAVASAEIIEEESLDDVDRAISAVLGSMVDRALAHRGDLTDVLSILLANMHPLDATCSICDAAQSPSAEVRRVLCNALSRERNIVGRISVLAYLAHDDVPEVRHAAVRAARE